MLGINYLGQTQGTQLITHEAELDGYRIVLSQEFMPEHRGGGYFHAIFDPAGHLRHVSLRDCIFLPVASSADAPEPDGRITKALAEGILGLIVPKLREIDERADAAG